MAKRKRQSNKASAINGPKNYFNSFKFPHDKVYSHKNQTVLIHPGNFHLMDEIVNVEIGSELARKQGFIVLRLHDDLRHVISDESMYQFLVQSGDHDRAKQKMKADVITFENVYSKQKSKKPIGIFCHSILLESVATGKSVKSLNEERRVTFKVPAEETDSEVNSSTSKCVISVASDNCMLDKNAAKFRRGQFIPADETKLLNECPCGLYTTKHSITNADLENHTNEARPLLHEAYVGQLRLSKYRSLQQNHISDPSRLNDAELLDCEAILSRMLRKTLHFEYMLYAGAVKIEPSYSEYMETTRKYDMSKQKNEIDECMVGDAKNGITFPWTYFGFAGSVFATHVEDIAYLNSVNLMLYGSPKVWIFVSADQAVDLQKATAKYLQNNAAQGKSKFMNCTLQHKMAFVHPALLDLWGIPYTVVVQKPGDIIYTCAGAFHTGFNLGVNVNLAKNTIHYDFKIMMLPELHTPVNDEMRCKPECPQSFDTFLENRVTGSFLLSFYKMLFKSNHSDCDMANMRTFLERFYSGAEILTPVSVKDDKVKRFVDDELKKKLEEIKQRRLSMEIRVAKQLCRLKCAEIREITATITLPVIDFEMDASFNDNAKIQPMVGLKLTQIEENEILTQIPFLHITVSHLEYGKMSEMQLSVNERLSQDDDEEIELLNESKSKQVLRNVTNYHELNRYWTTVIENEDYMIFKTPQEEGSKGKHNLGMLSNLDKLKNHLKSEKQLHKRKKRRIMHSVQIMENGSDQSQEEEHLVQEPYYQVLYEDSELKLIQISEMNYFICLICCDFKTSITDRVDTLEREECDKNIISEILKTTLKRSKGSFATPRNLKEHIEKHIITYKCLLCEKNNQVKTLKTKHDLAAHIRGEHQKHEVFCSICSQSFSQPRYLRNHWFDPEKCCVKLRVLGNGKNIKVDGFHCSICGKLAHKREEWMMHLNESPECYRKIRNVTQCNSDEMPTSES